jgi:hypothetical protein
MGWDEAFYYLAVEIPPGRFPWDSVGIQLALDTHLPRVGQHRVPRSEIQSEIGFEFLVHLAQPDSGSIAVIPDYNRHDSRVDPASGDNRGRFSHRPVVTRNRSDGRFDSLFVITNRGRFGRDGTFYPAQGYDRGRLRYGTEAQSSRSDWYLDERAGLLQLRIPWDLLNVSDPSTRTLIFDKAAHGPIGTAPATQFHFEAVVYRRDRQTPPRVIRSGAWQWEGWTEPVWHARLKPAFAALRAAWGDIR